MYCIEVGGQGRILNDVREKEKKKMMCVCVGGVIDRELGYGTLNVRKKSILMLLCFYQCFVPMGVLEARTEIIFDRRFSFCFGGVSLSLSLSEV